MKDLLLVGAAMDRCIKKKYEEEEDICLLYSFAVAAWNLLAHTQTQPVYGMEYAS